MVQSVQTLWRNLKKLRINTGKLLSSYKEETLYMLPIFYLYLLYIIGTGKSLQLVRLSLKWRMGMRVSRLMKRKGLALVELGSWLAYLVNMVVQLSTSCIRNLRIIYLIGLWSQDLYQLTVISLKVKMEWINGLKHLIRSHYLLLTEGCLEDHHIKEKEMQLKMMETWQG